MRLKTKITGIAAGLGLLATAALTAQTWTITIGPNDSVTSTLQAGAPNVITQGQATVNVSCQNGVDCSKAGLRLESNGATVAVLGPPTSSAIGLAFTVPQASVSNGMDLAVLFNGNKIDSYSLGTSSAAVAPSTTPAAPAVSTTPASLGDLLALPCPGTYTVPEYDKKGNLGEIVVNPLGTVLVSNLDTDFDENDSLVVRIVADLRLLPLLTAVRTSAFRNVTTVQIVGGDQTATALKRQGALVANCGEQKFLLSNFAPGRGQVQISALQGTQLAPTGSFDFNVNPLYTGMLTLGAARTDLVDPGFKIASVGGQTVIAAGEEGDQDLVYTLFYTPFVWGKRDLQKTEPWYKHFNPTIGVAPQDVTNNAFVGITADLPAGIALTFGRHFRQIEVLQQGLTVGSPFSGTADQLPTANKWEDDNFWAVSIDLRAMTQVLRAALGGGGS
jgi:hypothetical protein